MFAAMLFMLSKCGGTNGCGENRDQGESVFHTTTILRSETSKNALQRIKLL